MDYEKNNEALDIVKRMVADGQVSQEVAEKYFPELKESEDEKIRKDIIRFIKGCFPDETSEQRKTYLAWLEKQKEFVSADFDDVWETAGCEELTAPLEKYSKEAIKKMCHAWYDKGIELERRKWLEKQGEQKSTNSKEDDVRRVSTIQVLEYAKSLPDYNQFGKDAINKNIAWLEKQSEQNKQQLYDIIIALWDLLDKIDTFSDLQIDDTNPNNPFRKIEHITQERHKFVKTDGYNLFINDFMITNKKIEKQSEKPQGKSALEAAKEEKADN